MESPTKCDKRVRQLTKARLGQVIIISGAVPRGVILNHTEILTISENHLIYLVPLDHPLECRGVGVIDTLEEIQCEGHGVRLSLSDSRS